MERTFNYVSVGEMYDLMNYAYDVKSIRSRLWNKPNSYLLEVEHNAMEYWKEMRNPHGTQEAGRRLATFAREAICEKHTRR